MKILAVDTALGACSVAVVSGENVLSHRFEPMERGHAERLAPMVREVMQEAGLPFGGIDRLAVTTGPGTFTGQRVGLAFMRGLRVALRKPLVGITTLEAMLAQAMSATNSDAAAVLHHAKRNEAYCAGRIGAELVIPVSLVGLHEVADLLHEAYAGRAITFAGSAAEEAARAYRIQDGRAQIVAVVAPDALWVARLARSATEPRDTPKPLYLRPPDARLPIKAPE
jgi:tRNA threonylcarbamoyladenosine biosynthesis protein TsaB